MRSLVALSLVYFLYYILKFSIYPIDDAYIHFRISRHIVEHGLPYFNIDENVMGSSPHLWINLIALLFKVSDFNLSLVPYVEWVFTGGCFLCLIFLLQDRFNRILSVVLSFLVICVFLLPTAAGLMEQPLALFIVLLTFVFLRKENILAVGFCAGLGPWVRFEFFAFILLGLILMKSKDRKLFIYGAMAPILAFFAYTSYYFGTPLPYPMISKAVVFRTTLDKLLTNLPTAHSYSRQLYSIWPEALKATSIGIAFCLLYGILIYEAFKQKSAAWIKWSLFLSFSILCAYIIKMIYVFSWYVPLFSLPAVLASLMLLTKKTRTVGLLLFIIGYFNVFYVAATDTYAVLSGHLGYYDEYSPGWRVQQFLKIGQELYEKNPQALLLTSEIGGLGWSFKGKIYDGAALISPSALQYHPLTVYRDRPWSTAGAIPYQVVQDQNPDFIVSMNLFCMGVQREVHSGKLPYKIVQSWPIIPLEESKKTGITQVWRNDRIDVFERVTTDLVR